MKNLLFLALFISFIVFLMSISLFVYYITPVSVSSFQASATVTEDLGGFDLNSSALTFGSIALGGSSTRSILVNNSYSFPIRVESVIDGSIAEMIVYGPLTIQPYQTSSFQFSVFAGPNVSLGNYTGNISIRLLRA
ncbi:MAG: hypothetical protein AABX96_03115 [Nanoarchaeota archaeon]